MPTIEEQHLVLPLSNGKYYYTTIDENDELNRYHYYAEVIIPIDKLTDMSTALCIGFPKSNIENDDQLSDNYTNHNYYNTIMMIKLRKSLVNTNDVLYFDWVYFVNFDIPDNETYTSISGDFNFEIDPGRGITNISKDFIVLSIMINPQLNNPNKTITEDTTDFSSILFFIDGIQLYNKTSTDHLLPVYKFYSGADSVPQIIVYEDNSNLLIPYIIWNTEFERFIYKDLALMCYKDYDKIIINDALDFDTIRYPIFDTCLRQILYGGSRDGDHFNNGYAPYSLPYINHRFSNTLLRTSGFHFYKVYKITGNSSSDIIRLKFALVQVTDDNYNVFNYNYGLNYSNLTISDVPNQEIVGIEYNIAQGLSPQYVVCYLKTHDNQYRFGYAKLSDIVNFSPTEQTAPINSGVFYTINIYPTTINLDDVGMIRIEDISYSGNIPLPDDITEDEEKSLYMSPNNYHWKSLWKYNRTIEYSAPLQDNPVILPLNVFTDDDNENMFIEIVIDTNSADSQAPDTEDYCIALFDSLDFESDINDRITNTGSEYVNANFNNGISVSYMRGTMLRVHKYSSGTKTRLNQYISDAKKTAICFYYNSTDKKLMIHKKEKNYENYYVNFDLEISGVDKSYLKNLYIHSTYLTEGDSVPITINFGPTSDYFQDYIDEILDQDNREDEVDISSDAEVDGVPSYTFETYPYSQATYSVVITIKPPFIAPEDAAKIDESDYLTFSNSNLASYQYSYGVYNTDSMTLGYTLVFNRTHVPESTTEDVKKNNTDIIQISSSDGKYKYKITLKTIDVLKAGYFRFTSFDVPHTNLADLGEAAGQHSFNAIYNLYFESNISKYFITTDTSQWDEIISNTTIKAIGETSSSEATIIKNIEMKIEYVDTNRYINGRIEFKVNSQDMDFDQFNFRFTATYRLEELGIETTVTSPVITINGSGGTVTPEPGSYMFAAIPSGLKITDEDFYNNFDEIEEQSFTTFIEHTYDSNSSVIYISNNDEYVMNDCKAGLLTLAMGRTRSTITFTLEDPSYMDTIITNYEEIFNVRNTGIGLKGKDSSSTKYLIYSYSNDYNTLSINQISDNKFTLTLKCNYLVPSQSSTSFVKGENYTFISYTTIAYSNISVNNDGLFLSLMKSPCTTKLEFTIIGINDD